MENPYFNSAQQDQYWGDISQNAIDSYNKEQEMKNQPKKSQQDYAQAVSSGLAAGMSNSQNPDQFVIDPNAGLIASSEGFGSGGPIAAVIGGVTAQFGQQEDLKNALNGINPTIRGVSYDAYGRPVYRGAGIQDAQATIKQLDEGERAMTQGAIQGGTGLDPAVLVFNELYGNTRRLRDKRKQLQQGIEKANTTYNQNEIGYRNQQNSLEDYRQRTNNSNRLYNMYRSQY